MPEGPELFLASQFVNRIGQSNLFSGKVVKSEVSIKNPDVDWDEKSYTISSTSRGKEVKLILQSTDGNTKKTECKSLCIVFRFGMSGVFRFDPVDKLHKHAHLNFYTKDKKKVLSFVDVRRFGKWEVSGDWGDKRGPCVLQEYGPFRKNVLDNVEKAAFDRPICETLLNQSYFNGIGNYLRAEILFRAGIRPFDKARDVLDNLVNVEDVKMKSENPDILQLCHTIPTEVINLGGKGYDPEAGNDDYSAFSDWLQCYYNSDMKSVADHNGRTIWFSGEAGPMAPKDAKIRGRKGKSAKKTRKTVKVLADHDYTSKTKKSKRRIKEETENHVPTPPKNRKIKKETKEVSEGQKVTENHKPMLAKKGKTETKTEEDSKKQKSNQSSKKTVKRKAKNVGTRKSERLAHK